MDAKVTSEDMPVRRVVKNVNKGSSNANVKKEAGNKKVEQKKKEVKEVVNPKDDNQEAKKKEAGNKKGEQNKKDVKQEAKPKGKKEETEKKESKQETKPKGKKEETDKQKRANKDDKKKTVVKKEPGVDTKKTEEADSDTLTDPKQAVVNKGLGLMADLLENMEDEVLSKRHPQLAPSLKEPFVGGSYIKRIIMGAYASDAIYDPFVEVDETKLWNLKDYIRKDDDEPATPADAAVEFYRVIITPRESWRDETYGWLSSEHIEACFAMFRKRSTLDPTPFCSSRIAFIGPYTVTSWVHDFKNFKVTSFDWSDSYVKLFNGEYPADAVTNKKWIADVDRLFVCHNINRNHWVALDIKLVDGQIDVYDSIPSLSSDKAIADACLPFSKMIPALLNHMIPQKSRKKKFTQFKVKRVKDIPQNDNPGDYGIYALKYIECLALGCKFDGLCDDIIQRLHERLATELLEEVPEPVDYGLPLGDGDDDDVEDITTS